MRLKSISGWAYKERATYLVQGSTLPPPSKLELRVSYLILWFRTWARNFLTSSLISSLLLLASIPQYFWTKFRVIMMFCWQPILYILGEEFHLIVSNSLSNKKNISEVTIAYFTLSTEKSSHQTSLKSDNVLRKLYKIIIESHINKRVAWI